MDEILVSPDTPDDLERFEEHLARLLLVDAERLEFRRTQSATQPHIEASASQIVEHRRLLGDKQRMPERQDVDHAAEADALRRSRRGGDQQIGRGDRCCWLQMMLEEPDLIDADTFGQLDFFKLPPEHFHMCRIFAWGRGRPDGESHLPPSRFKRRRAARAAASWFYGPLRGGFRQSPPVLFAV